MRIIGAGLAGLLAGGMIRSQRVAIFEKQNILPNNHSAVMRFKSSIIGDTLGIPFKAVQVLKAVASIGNPVADALAYSRKCTGTATIRSIGGLTTGPELKWRYVAPEGLLEAMQRRVNGGIFYGSNLTDSHWAGFDGSPVISTIPMPALMAILEYDKPTKFQYSHGFNITADLRGVDAYATLYVPNPKYQFNRVTLTGNKITIEFSFPNATFEMLEPELKHVLTQGSIERALKLLGLTNDQNLVGVFNEKVSFQNYSKILPIDEGERRRFIVWATDKHNVYSLGRYATWRPGLLLDDLVNDVRVIMRHVEQGPYEGRMK